MFDHFPKVAADLFLIYFIAFICILTCYCKMSEIINEVKYNVEYNIYSKSSKSNGTLLLFISFRTNINTVKTRKVALLTASISLALSYLLNNFDSCIYQLY